MSDRIISEAPGEDEGTDVIVSRSVSSPLKDVWSVLMTAKGTETFMGPGAVIGDKGQSWESSNGRRGVIRSFHPLEQVRYTIRRDDDTPPSLVSIRVNAAGDDASELIIKHSQLTPERDRERLALLWEDALERFAELCEKD